MQTAVLQPRRGRRQQAAVLQGWRRGRRIVVGRVRRLGTTPVSRLAAGHHRAHRGREHTVPADRGTVQPHTGTGAATDHLLVVSAERARHIHVLVAAARGAGQLVVAKLRTEQPVVLQGPQAPRDRMRRPGPPSR